MSEPVRLCLDCNADIESTFAQRLRCEACVLRQRRRAQSAREKERRARAGKAADPVFTVNGKRIGRPSIGAKGRHCKTCERLPWRRRSPRCAECREPYAPEQNEIEIRTRVGVWNWTMP